jgi:thiol-disulfide isomerase/thioredoxin
MEGLLYVVYNEWIINPKTGKMPYKIGITKKTVDERYYGLGLKMPGTFKTLFAYLFDDCDEAEVTIQRLYKKYRVNGEWFEIDDDQIELLKKNCNNMGGRLVTEETQKEILEDSQKDYSSYIRKEKDMSKYQLNGQPPDGLGKGRLVLAVIKLYVEKHPDVTLKELQEIFPKRLQGSIGVIDTRENARIRYKDKRHFIKKEEIIKLKTGEKIVVSTEWGRTNIDDFIEKAKEMGFDILKKEENNV